MMNPYRRNKYGNRKVVIDNKEFDSQKEGNRYLELKLLQRAGKIKDLKLQVKFELIPKQQGERACNYVADFVYTENGQLVVEDTKGFRTADYKIKRKLMLHRWGIRIREI